MHNWPAQSPRNLRANEFSARRELVGLTNALGICYDGYTARAARSGNSLTSASSPRSHDLVLILLAAAGCIVASYLTLYQLGAFPAVWEPFFGDGSRLLLHSSVASSLPVPDASLGAVGYLAEVLCVTVRSRTGEWVRRVYRVLVALFAVASVVLVALQWGYFHAWCTLCLTSALLSLIIAGVVAGETVMRKE